MGASAVFGPRRRQPVREKQTHTHYTTHTPHPPHPRTTHVLFVHESRVFASSSFVVVRRCRRSSFVVFASSSSSFIVVVVVESPIFLGLPSIDPVNCSKDVFIGECHWSGVVDFLVDHVFFVEGCTACWRSGSERLVRSVPRAATGSVPECLVWRSST